MKTQSLNTLYRKNAWLLKVLLLTLIGWYLYRQVFQVHNATFFAHYFMLLIEEPSSKALMCLVCAMMLLNWLLESIKWRMLIYKLENISIFKAVQAVFTGIAVSIFTPNRIGEFGGRILVLQKADRVGAVLVTILSSMSQLLITLLIGGLALMFYFMDSSLVPDSLRNTTLVLTPLILSALLLFYFRVDVLQKIMNTFAITRKQAHHTEVLAHFSRIQLAKALALSLLRYATFTTQYLILLHITGVEANLFDTTLMIVLTYLLLAIPGLTFIDLGGRLLVAYDMLGTLSDNQVGIFTATSLLYMINIALPAFIGSFFILRLKFFRDRDE
jgi:hypothetical protein